MIKIGVLTPDATDALAFYRSTGPLSAMRKTHSINYEIMENSISWATLRKFDVVFMHRPWRADHLQVMEMAKKWGVPVMVEYDDFLLDLPFSNPAYNAFLQARDTVKSIINLADSVMVSTDHLERLLRPVTLDQSKPIHVVPNAYDHNLFKHYRHTGNVKERMKIFLWRGGNSHLEDLLSVKEEYLRLFEEHPDWTFIFVATHPWILDAQKFPNVKTADPMGLVEYFRAIHDTAPAIVAHPLVDNDFNRCKSMCSWIEATHARAAFIGPDFEEFNRSGVVQYGKDKSFYDCAKELISNPELLFQKYNESEHSLNTEFALDIVNSKRFVGILQTACR